jgi:hypothetical protein
MKLENPVRRDLQLVALFTGIRSDGVRNLRWEEAFALLTCGSFSTICERLRR